MILSKMIPRRVIFYTAGIALIILAIGIRYIFIGLKSNYDLDMYLIPWYQHIQLSGLSGFKTEFSNYNLPYLYLLLITSKLGIGAVVGIKLISIIFDFVLAYAVYLVVIHFKPNKLVAGAAALTSLFLPTVLLNGSLWGQCDVIYTSFILFSFWAALKDRPVLTWIFWGLAFAFKLQAIFFLPFLVFLWFTRTHRSRLSILSPLISIGIFLLPFIPAMIVGRSFTSILGIYAGQAGASNPLTVNAANVYQWIPSSTFDNLLKPAGILFSVALIVAVLVLALTRLRKRPRNLELLLLATLLLWILPFFLPTMHERYFFVAEIFTFLLAFTFSARYKILAITAQIGTAFAYMPYFFNRAPVSLGIIAGAELIIVGFLFYDALMAPRIRPVQYLKH